MIFFSGGGENLWQPAGFSLSFTSHPVNTWIYVTTSNCICYGCDQPQLSGFHHHITPVEKMVLIWEMQDDLSRSSINFKQYDA